MVAILEVLECGWERIAFHKVEHILHLLLRLKVPGAELLPWLPLLYDLQQFDLVVRLKDKFLDEAGGDCLLDGANGRVLVHDGHAEPRQLLAKELVPVRVRHVFELLEGEVVQFHELHSWEWLHIQVSNTSGKLKERRR